MKNNPASLGDNVDQLNNLGSNTTAYTFDSPRAEILEAFPNQFPETQYEVRLECPEFTSLCPKTSQPDFGDITITYVPRDLCVETKSLKLYLFAFRNTGSFMETIVNTILKDLVSVIDPLQMQVNGRFASRGGVTVDVSAFHFAPEVERTPR